jgi:prepilin-type N-terminal cleavage/methylation domain-containing protein
MSPCGNRGFSLVELIVALGVTLIVTATIFDLVGQSRRRFEAEPEVADRQQRIRSAVDALYRDLLMASAVMPYRAVASSPDPPGTFRNDVVTIVTERGSGEDQAIRTYYLRSDARSGKSPLMRAEGGGGDAPVVDGVASLTFEYFGDPPTGGPETAEPCNPADGGPVLAPIAGAELADGPWCDTRAGGDPFDADLLRIRKVAVRMRVAGQSGEIRFEVAPRNRNHGR